MNCQRCHRDTVATHTKRVANDLHITHICLNCNERWFERKEAPAKVSNLERLARHAEDLGMEKIAEKLRKGRL